MNTKRETEFFMLANKVWDGLNFEKKLDILFEKGSHQEKIDPLDPEENPFFIVAKMFRNELLSREIVEGTKDDEFRINTFLLVKFLQRPRPGVVGNKHTKCKEDCTNCPDLVNNKEDSWSSPIDDSNKTWN